MIEGMNMQYVCAVLEIINQTASEPLELYFQAVVSHMLVLDTD